MTVMTGVTLLGKMETEIKTIKDMIAELKADNKETDVKIKEAIQEHIEIYHKGGK